jgi:hypothetical protein
MTGRLDITDLVLVYTTLFANLAADMHAARLIDGRSYADALTIGPEWTDEARGAMDFARERLLIAIERREAQATGLRIV